MIFTIGPENSTQLRFNTKEEFLKHVEELINKAEENGVEYFDVEIDMD